MSYSLPYTKKNLKKLSFLVYGLGSTGNSVIRYFKKRKIWDYVAWDDNAKLRKKFNSQITTNLKSKLRSVDYIVLSPGISLKKTKHKKDLRKFKYKIITDLDLLYICNSKTKTIVITGTNGKSTTCKILEHVLKKNKVNVRLGGNIGKPILDLKLKDNPLLIIEASSFQLAYSRFVKPDYALILNITNDHLDWHGSMKKYTDSKLKIFSLQNKNNFAFIGNKNLLKKFKKKNYLPKLNYVNPHSYKKIKDRVKNIYLNSKTNEENMNFVFTLSRFFKIKEKSLIKSLNSFKGLPHRYEIFLKQKNKVFINDSKATSFQASKSALLSNDNIFWIVGGMPKLGDKFKLDKIKNKIIKSYIIGNYMKKFKKKLSGKVRIVLSKTLKSAVISIFKDIRNIDDKQITILLSPASASYDQFKNFEERGNQFKKLIKNYARRYF
tara:strand:+ start:950 stop:2260 length:1311 start_codon:yes stop_codon:yes gene_type:complete